MKLWSGRFTSSTDQLVDEFTASLPWDLRLYPYDIKASIEHVNMLAAQKIIADNEAEQIKGIPCLPYQLPSHSANFSGSAASLISSASSNSR